MQGYPKNKLWQNAFCYPKWMKRYDIETFTGVLECSWVKNISVPFPSAWSGKRKSFHFSRHNFNKPSKFLDLQCSTIVNYGVRNWALVRVELECKENEKDKFVFNYRSTFGEAKPAGVYNICARLVFDRRQLENRKGFKLLVLSLTKNFKLCLVILITRKKIDPFK